MRPAQRQTIFKRLVEGPGPRRRQEVVQLPHSRRPAPSRQSARRVAAAVWRQQRLLPQGLPALRAPDGHGVHGAQLLHVAVLRIEAPRRVRRRSEGVRVLHRLDAPVGKVLVVLELVGVVLQQPELGGRLLLHVLGRAVHRLVRPGVVGPGRPLEVVAPLPALARHARGQVLLQRLDAPVHHGRGVAVLGPLRAAHGFRGQLPVQHGELVAQVGRDHKVLVVPRQLPRGALGGPAAVSAFLFCKGSTAASQVKTSITTRPYLVFPRVFWLKSMRSACSRSFGPLEGHGLRHVKVALQCESVQLPRVPHVKAVGQISQRLHVLQKQLCGPNKGLALASLDAGRPAHSFFFYLFFGPRRACQASTSSSRAWKPLHTPQSS